MVGCPSKPKPFCLKRSSVSHSPHPTLCPNTRPTVPPRRRSRRDVVCSHTLGGHSKAPAAESTSSLCDIISALTNQWASNPSPSPGPPKCFSVLFFFLFSAYSRYSGKKSCLYRAVRFGDAWMVLPCCPLLSVPPGQGCPLPVSVLLCVRRPPPRDGRHGLSPC